MNKKLIIGAVLTLGLAAAAVYLAFSGNGPANTNVNANTNQAYPLPGAYPSYPIGELAEDARNSALNSGRFNTSGVVIDIPTCPPCPRDAVCIPCPAPTLVIAQNANTPDTETLRIELKTDATGFTVGQSYAFSVLVDSEAKTVELIGARSQ